MAGRDIKLTNGGTLVFEEAVADGVFKSTVSVSNLTADRSLHLPDADGDIFVLGGDSAISTVNGGTGLTNVPLNNILLGTGDAALALLAPPDTSNQTLVWNGETETIDWAPVVYSSGASTVSDINPAFPGVTGYVLGSEIKLKNIKAGTSIDIDVTPNDLTINSTLSLDVLPAANITGQVAVANGGTGQATLTSRGVLVGNGTSAVNTTVAPTVGNTFLRTNAANNGFEWAPAANTFLGLTDAPATFAGSNNKWVKVNSGASALEFVSFAISNDAAPVLGGNLDINGKAVVNSSVGTPNIAITSGTGGKIVLDGQQWPTVLAANGRMFLSSTIGGVTSWQEVTIVSGQTFPSSTGHSGKILVSDGSTTPFWEAKATSAEILAGSTSKTIQVTQADNAMTWQTLTDGSTITVNHNNGRRFTVTTASARTIAASNLKDGQQVIIVFTGNYVHTYSSAWDFTEVGGTPTVVWPIYKVAGTVRNSKIRVYAVTETAA